MHALRQWQDGNGGADWPATADTAVSEALREIHADPGRLWAVQELSSAVGLSRTTFTKRFSTAMGKTPTRYLVGWRQARAAQLLRETSSPLAAIARQVGYSTEFAFAAAFRREHGISPGRYRQSVAGAADAVRAERLTS